MAAPRLVAVIGDTHLPRGSRRLAAACVEAVAAADLVIHVGDFSAMSAYEEIRALGPPLVAVHGNVDDSQLRRLLPERAEIDLGGWVVGVIHDAGPKAGRLARMRRAFPDADAVVFGHSHIPLHERDPDGFQIFNPGSPTERRRAPRHTMGLLRATDDGLRFEHLALA